MGTESAFAEDGKAAPKKQDAPLLEFRAVHPENAPLARRVETGSEPCPQGYELLSEPERDKKGDPVVGENGLPVVRPILVKREPIATGSDILQASPDFNRPGVITITLTEKGGLAMQRYTNSIKPGRDRMAHVLNGKVLSAPGFESKNLGKSFIITGIPGGNAGANKLCNTIMAGKQKDRSE